jgi:hypothetical protein
MNIGSPGMDLATPIVMNAKEGGENYENRNIIFGSPAFRKHTGSA